MVKQTKSDTKTSAPATASAQMASTAPIASKKEKSAAPTTKIVKDVAPVVAAVAEEVKTPAKKKVKTTAAAVPTPEVVVASAVAVVDAAAVAAAPVTETITSEFLDFFTKLQQVSAQFAALKTDFRSLEKKASREIKTATKASAKRKRKTGNRSPSGFVKPTLISTDLATFLGKPQGTEMARTEVTREINAYIRANSLQDKTNGRKINADAKLSALLKLTDDCEALTYFNLQRYMSPHFQKAAAAVAAVAAQ